MITRYFVAVYDSLIALEDANVKFFRGGEIDRRARGRLTGRKKTYRKCLLTFKRFKDLSIVVNFLLVSTTLCAVKASHNYSIYEMHRL